MGLVPPAGLSNARVLADRAGETGPLEAGVCVPSEPAGGKLRGGREVWSGWPWLSHIEEAPSFAERWAGPRAVGGPRPLQAGAFITTHGGWEPRPH